MRWLKKSPVLKDLVENTCDVRGTRYVSRQNVSEESLGKTRKPFYFSRRFFTMKGWRNLPASEMRKAKGCWLEGHYGSTFKIASCDFLPYGWGYCQQEEWELSTPSAWERLETQCFSLRTQRYNSIQDHCRLLPVGSIKTWSLAKTAAINCLSISLGDFDVAVFLSLSVHFVWHLCVKGTPFERVVQGNVLFCIRYAPSSGNTTLNKAKYYASYLQKDVCSIVLCKICHKVLVV